MSAYLRDLDSNISGFLTPVLKWIFYICIGVFLLLFLVPGQLGGAIVSALGASPGSSILRGRIYQLVTYAFVHAGFMHLFFNLLALYFFGGRLEQRWGSARFLRFVLIAAAGSVLTHLIVVGLRVALGAPSVYLYDQIVGISGVVYACLLACAMYYPDDIVYFQFLLPIKLKYFVAILGVLALISTPRAGDSIAHLTHLGGFLMGYLFVKFPNAFDWIPLVKFRSRRREPEYPDPRERWRKF